MIQTDQWSARKTWKLVELQPSKDWHGRSLSWRNIRYFHFSFLQLRSPLYHPFYWSLPSESILWLLPWGLELYGTGSSAIELSSAGSSVALAVSASSAIDGSIEITFVLCYSGPLKKCFPVCIGVCVCRTLLEKGRASLYVSAQWHLLRGLGLVSQLHCNLSITWSY